LIYENIIVFIYQIMILNRVALNRFVSDFKTTIMKTLFYLLAFCCGVQFTAKAQSQSVYLPDEFRTEPVIKKNEDDKLKPVFYNFTRRRLYTSNKMPLNGQHFLELCRNISDPNVQLQIRRYDQLSHNKKKLVTATLLCGIGGYVTLVASTMSGLSQYSTNRHYIGMGIGAAALLATPFLAISTGIPHQKRKEILFHDLPEAYNFYVTSPTNH